MTSPSKIQADVPCYICKVNTTKMYIDAGETPEEVSAKGIKCKHCFEVLCHLPYMIESREGRAYLELELLRHYTNDDTIKPAKEFGPLGRIAAALAMAVTVTRSLFKALPESVRSKQAAPYILIFERLHDLTESLALTSPTSCLLRREQKRMETMTREEEQDQQEKEFWERKGS